VRDRLCLDGRDRAHDDQREMPVVASNPPSSAASQSEGGGAACSPPRHVGTILPRDMRLVIVRHAEAAPGDPDELRSLTPAGRKQAQQLGDSLRADGIAADAVLSSPLLRARETAQALGLGEPGIDERLAPGASPADIRDAARGRGETVVVVGHQPDCGRAVAELGGRDEPAFPPCAHALVELE
jgi:phosphohistidine phosphatase